VKEDIEHLLFLCPFATSCWIWLGIHWNMALDFYDRVMEATKNFSASFLMEIF
jgi:hypothetical protein